MQDYESLREESERVSVPAALIYDDDPTAMDALSDLGLIDVVEIPITFGDATDLPPSLYDHIPAVLEFANDDDEDADSSPDGFWHQDAALGDGPGRMDD